MKVKKIIPIEFYRTKRFLFITVRTKDQILKVFPVPYKHFIDYKKFKKNIN